MFGNKAIDSLIHNFVFTLASLPFAAMAQEPFFSHSHGLYDEPFVLSVSTTEPLGELYYTLDGSDPRIGGTRFNEPFTIGSTTVVRAATLLPDGIWSNVTTASYLFPESILNQTDKPAGYPALWGSYCQIQGTAIADYGMDPDLTRDPELRPKMLEGLHDLPVISIVTDKDNLFSHERDEERGGIYIYTGCPVGDGIGRGWERPVSFELFGGPSDDDLTVDCCIKLHGGHGRLPEKNPKHAFRLHFKGDYGPSKLRYPVFGESGPAVHNALVLRTFFGYSWTHWDNTQRSKAQYCRDMWARYAQAKMGHPVSLARYAHLFINGMYWGLYNMCERVTDDFCAEKFGGKASDWDVTEVDGGAGNYHAAIADYGNLEAWNQMADLIYTLPNKRENYLRLIGLDSQGKPSPDCPPLLDVDNFIDYMLINLYGGNSDWDHHNWYAYRNRVSADKGFRFICWDTETIFISQTDNLTNKNNRGCPTGFLNRLMKEPPFAHRFHEAAQRHLFHGGALTPESAICLWDSLYGTISMALYDESARWGDYRRDVHPYSSRGSLYTVDGLYQSERKRLLNSYFPSRTSLFVKQLQDRGWFPSAPAPEFSLDGRAIGYATSHVNMGSELRITGDDVYYTTDGADPVSWMKGSAGTVTPSAVHVSSGADILESLDWYNLPDTIMVSAISRSGTEWSPIVRVRLVVEHPVPDYSFSAQPPVFRRGANGRVSLCVDNQKPFCAWQADVVLPEGIEWALDSDGKPICQLSTERTTTDNHTLSFGKLSSGAIRLTCRQRKGIPFEGNSGETAVITLRSVPATPQGTYTLELRNVRITDDSGEVHAQGNTSCAILVCDATRGDLNGDGAVDYEDLSLMRDIVLGMGKDGREVADLNGDGAVDGADLVRLSRAILGFVDLDE